MTAIVKIKVITKVDNNLAIVYNERLNGLDKRKIRSLGTAFVSPIQHETNGITQKMSGNTEGIHCISNA
jgi:hypothetical protein